MSRQIRGGDQREVSLKTYDYRNTNWNRINDKMDLIISCCSVGVHVPIEKVLPNMLKICSDNCVFIFSARTNKKIFPIQICMKIDFGYISEIFENINFIERNQAENLRKGTGLPKFDFLICKK